ncbi:FAD linked oxidase domain protein [Leptothrix cholodnii SP-6]|uniref:FAD linked oxidase domain protein n=1 Tax=Leptothrix cholodnii (strain ATCC 51168 / LMG 8142 / SP-6) TaxID=395495 RepID=B1Y1Q5_LEPCP|nr:glycolate oxidase subunit GlcE [Leptothrix cholodnii]ACB35517.1 FAD linked oxidase domain protein [Leptothrix cholodnii SP-6]
MSKALNSLVERVRAARDTSSPLAIRGAGTKAFYGEAITGSVLDTRDLTGISSYEPSELVLTARAGTPLAEVEAALAERGQCLPFEPPRFPDPERPGQRGGTIGGVVASGLAGPARASAGGVRDYVLGATLLNGEGEVLSFGGQVMKNVAGYDVSRLLAGSLGVLGVICEVSLKVLPVPPATTTLRFDCEQARALDLLQTWGGQPLPLNASAWWQGALIVRLSGAVAAVESASHTLGGEVIDARLAQGFWAGLRDQTDEFFNDARRALADGAALWRVSVPAGSPPLALQGEQLIEWGGAQRWWVSRDGVARVRQVAAQHGGHATLYRAKDKAAVLAGATAASVFEPLKAPLDRIHRDLKKSFDPHGLFNPGRLYPHL